LLRGAPILALAVVAFVVGVILAGSPGGAERQTVTEYVRAWSRGEYGQMYDLLDRVSQRQISRVVFAQDLRNAAATATVASLRPGRMHGPNGNVIDVRMRVRTRIWGVLEETLLVPLSGSGSGARIRFASTLLFPGLRGNERLHRTSTLAPRASLLADDGTPLAEGPARFSPLPGVGSEIVGTLGPAPADEASRYAAQGYPPGAQVGLDGLERIFQTQLAGTPGGRLLAGHRVLAQRPAVRGHTVQTTISPSLEEAAIRALAGAYAGLAVMNPRTGGILALAGIAFSAPQPPGSTMKIITTAAALQAGITSLSTSYPIQTAADIQGYLLHNASSEACGGTLLNAFAVSCNSVFAPLGAKLGGARLVAAAERFGFNQPSSIPGAAESTIPAPIGSALAVASSAIGQGMVQSTPLGMTDVAAAIAMGGRRPIPTLLAHQRPRFVRATSPRVAHEVQQMMLAVVQFGTGTSAQIPGIAVAGKTGTAELTNTGDASNPNASSAKNTDAWFVGYAPAGRPHIVAGALFPNAGFGGATAAPPVRAVLAAALHRG
jgi:cell division protein FtsI/penicillin-binding protein 2